MPKMSVKIMPLNILRPQYKVVPGHSAFASELQAVQIATETHISLLTIHNVGLLEELFNRTVRSLILPR